MNALLLYCRAGFEAECAAQIQALAAAHQVAGYCQTQRGAAYVLFHTADGAQLRQLLNGISFKGLIFARQWFGATAELTALPSGDRVSALVAALRRGGTHAQELFVETPDSDATKPLSALCRSITGPLARALRDAHQLTPNTGHRDAPSRGSSATRLHVCFTATDAAFVGGAPTDNSSPWPMGIPRLKAARGAPSRAAQKLEEAFLTFLPWKGSECPALKPGMRAVDLGAAPGGWTWQLVRRHIHVTAVDNGQMAPELMDSGLVDHRREDGFRFHPRHPVDWLVCDMVEQPRRIAALLSQWLVEGWCTRAIGNLKLPMKRRYAEVQSCLDLIRDALTAANVQHSLHCKQLYHDREEVTVYVERERDYSEAPRR